MTSSANNQSTQEKALQINLDENKYGTIVEIGAGQEVARQFFRAGAAAGTIAKTMSAYDMQFSMRSMAQNPAGVTSAAAGCSPCWKKNTPWSSNG